MKRILLLFLVAVFLQTVLFSQQPPKRDVRAVWLTTAWTLDWPTGGARVPAPTFAPDGVTITNEAARETARNHQKNSLLSILNRLDAANINTIYFQVRPMSDAFYRSSFEPWSHWLSSVRGADPGWSPLGFLIEHAHARGIEVHAWLNPYRYSTSSATFFNSLPNDYAVSHPHWILDYVHSNNSRPYMTILNPGIPEVKERIADIVEDIIRNYNVDGIVFDDYFYVSGTTDAMDQAQFDAYNPHGFGRAEWRRENVNEMIRLVQERINSISPWVQWGVSPAGVASSNPAVAAGHGVEPSPGSDWQYGDISSDPVMWLRRGTIDYISPQIYWPIGSGPATDYEAIAAWWSRVTNQFGRHFFSSNTKSFDSRFGTINVPNELVNQVIVNQNEDLNGVTGAVFFRTTNAVSQSVYNALVAGPYRYRALTANFGWKPASVQGLVTNLNVSGQNVTWNYTPVGEFGVRYAVYAVPNANRNDADAFTSPRFLQGVSYTTTFTLPSGISASTHRIGVAVFDRFGNLFPVRVHGESEATIAPAQLTYPANNQQDVIIPSMFTWEANGADFYVWQIAEDRDFERPIASRETTTPNFNLGFQSNIRGGATYYWRVKSIRANAPVSVSEVRSFYGIQFQILTPASGDTDVSLTPEITWPSIGDGASYTLEISMQADFSNILHADTVQTTSATIPPGVLRIATTYHARVRTELGVIRVTSSRMQFTTEGADVSVPVLVSPTDGEVIHGNEVAVSWQEQISRGFRVELANNPDFSARAPNRVHASTVEFNDFNTTFRNMTAGTYYLRVRAFVTSQALTAWSEVITIHLETETSIPEHTVADFLRIHHVSEGMVELVINQAESNSATVEIYSLTGSLLDRQVHGLNIGTSQIMLDMTGLRRGIYLVRVNAGNNTKTLKIHR